MNRAERRKKQKLDKRKTDKKVDAVRWVSSLPPEKAELVQAYANFIAKRDNKLFTGALERCYSAAIIEELEFLELEEVEKVIEKFAELMKDDAEKMTNNKEEFGGDLEMATKKVNELGPVVEERARKLLSEGYNQKLGVKVLYEEFPALSRAMVTNAWKKVKAMVSDENKSNVNNAAVISLDQEEKEINEALDYIFDNDTDEKNEYDFNTESLVENSINKEAVKDNFVEDEFEIVKEVRIIDLKGKFGEYHVERNLVEVKEFDLAFCNAAEVKQWASDEREVIAHEIEALKLQMDRVNEREKETIKVIEKFM